MLTRFLAATVVALAAVSTLLPAAGGAPHPARGVEPTAAAKKRCKVVKKRVRGKVRRVRVCRVVKPQPRPPAPPLPQPPAAGGLHVTARIPVVGRPNVGSLAVGYGSVWVRMAPDQVHRIDPTTNRVVASTTVGTGSVGWVVAGHGTVWISNYDSDTVSRLDPGTNTVVATIPVGDAPTGLAVTDGAVWVANHHANSVSRIDPATNTVVATIPVATSVPEIGPQALAVVAGSVWMVGVDVPPGPQLKRIDPVTNVVTVVRPISGGCSELGVGATVWMWTDGCEAGAVAEIDPLSGATLGMAAVGAPGDVDVGLGALWVANVEAEIVRVDPVTRAVTGRLRVGELAGVEPAVAVGEGAVWAAGVGMIVRVEP